MGNLICTNCGWTGTDVLMNETKQGDTASCPNGCRAVVGAIVPALLTEDELEAL